ncbi:MAG: hypothetical protein PHT07_11955 [Paludibacter sp.]|nr:hypothetical protein [Paludibacter sp.]
MKNYNLLIGFLLFLSACAPKHAEELSVLFNQPQPENVKNLIEIPISYRGKYMDNDSNLLKVDKTNMIVESFLYFKISKQEADTSKYYHIENRYLVISGTKEKLPFRLKDDTLYVKESRIDTIYNLKSDIIHKFKGYLILNKESDDLWNVKIASIKSGEIKIRNFSPVSMFEKLTKFSNSEVATDKTKKIVIKRFLKPTRKQFENILNYKDSLSVDIFKKVK